jgi:transposase-like protein
MNEVKKAIINEQDKGSLICPLCGEEMRFSKRDGHTLLEYSFTKNTSDKPKSVRSRWKCSSCRFTGFELY